jgi:hypothetical protein
MKKILLLALLLIPFFGFSQTTKPIEGFMGIKFGSSKAEVIAAMQAKGLTQSQIDKPDILIFNNPVLGTKTASAMSVLFVNDKAFEANILFTPDADDHAIIFYNNLVDDINSVYGKGEDHKDFRGSFKEGDGYELTAIQGGDADYYTTWRSGTNRIKVKISVKLTTVLIYVDNTLSDENDAQKKAQNSF